VIIINTDGTAEFKRYADYTSICSAVNPPGRDDPFTSVPLEDHSESGYTVYANDNGMLIPLPRNKKAEQLTGYPELYGPICVTSFEESGEDECMGYIVEESRAAFEQKLRSLCLREEGADSKTSFDGAYANIPEQTQNSLKYYMLRGQPTGGFLSAVLCNNLMEAATRGDLEHRAQLVNITLWIYSHLPAGSHGSEQRVEAWIKKKGLQESK